jgi:membrane protein implicated in regulation of membrane protease activity
MNSVFIFCALVGGTVLACQFVLTLIGMDDGIDGSHEAPHDAHFGGHHDVNLNHATDGDAHGDHGAHHHGSTWLFGVISFRTLVAALTFFGLTGMSARSAGLPLHWQLLIAGGSGMAAMYGVHWIMRLFYKLNEDGTVRIDRAVGQRGTVYVPIPAGKSGAGKIQLKVQGRLVEYDAVTAGEAKLPTGARVVVVGVLGSNTLDVEPLPEKVGASNV